MKRISREALRSVAIERTMPHSPDKVWRALVERALLEGWLMRNDFQPVEGHRFQFRDGPMPRWDGVVDCEVLIVDPHNCLAYSWNTSTGLRTVVTWSLMPTPEGTHLRMEQSGFRPEVEANYRGAQHRWRKFIKGLERVVSNLE